MALSQYIQRIREKMELEKIIDEFEGQFKYFDDKYLTLGKEFEKYWDSVDEFDPKILNQFAKEIQEAFHNLAPAIDFILICHGRVLTLINCQEKFVELLKNNGAVRSLR